MQVCTSCLPPVTLTPDHTSSTTTCRTDADCSACTVGMICGQTGQPACASATCNAWGKCWVKEDTSSCCNGVSNGGLPSGDACGVIAGGGALVDPRFLGGNCIDGKLWERCVDPSKAATKLVVGTVHLTNGKAADSSNVPSAKSSGGAIRVRILHVALRRCAPTLTLPIIPRLTGRLTLRRSTSGEHGSPTRTPSSQAPPRPPSTTCKGMAVRSMRWRAR